MESSKKILLMTIGIALLVVIASGITFAFFNYSRTGVANNISTGRIYFNTTQNGTLNLTNLFPVVSNEVGNSNQIEVRIWGDTTYSGGEEFEISLVDVNNTIVSGSTEKTIPINYVATYVPTPVATGETANVIGTSSNDYFNDRGSTTAVYQLNTTGEVTEGEQVLIGYIPKDIAIDGTLTIKAYLDASDIAISDTYNEASPETDYNGTTTEWVGDRTVLTTSEWNTLRNTPISFKVRAIANDGIWIENHNLLYNMIKDSAVLDTNISYGEVFTQNSERDIFMLNSTANNQYPVAFYRGVLDYNNVYFAGYCWQIVRTTNTGGVKILYNGLNTGTNDEPKCGSTSSNNGLGRADFVKNRVNGGPGHVGYMYGSDYYVVVYGAPAQDSLFGSTFTYDDYDNNGTSEYKIAGSVDVGKSSNRHYTCNLSNSDGTCAEIRYYYSNEYYILLKNGTNIVTALNEMFENNLDSNVKEVIDNWFATNMISYTNKLEDTIWCSDRSISNYGGWSETGAYNNNLAFSSRDRLYGVTPNLNCSLNDSFTMHSENGNGKLDYPVGLITVDEAILAGASSASGNSGIYLSPSGSDYWTMTPSNVFYNGSGGTYLTAGLISTGSTNYDRYVRPMVSLKYGAEVMDGEGTKTKPYIVE